ncbi:MAG: hypothetical protein LIP77_08380, partial [Planctomycetes bacterium]|nr:hypothetical protein [Planctomycetota bacterium]
HAFINHMFDPAMAARTMESKLFYLPNRAALARMRPDFTANPLLFFSGGEIGNSEAVRDIGDDHILYEEVWEALLIDHD